MRRPRQLAIDFPVGKWSGRKKGSGRKEGPNPSVRHRSRKGVDERLPCHVTLKVRRGIQSLRTIGVVREIEASFRKACSRGKFRLVHYSIQDDHVHLLVEAESRRALGCGMKSIAARLARAVNRTLDRTGPVLADRYHLHVLGTPREVRNALAYVLLNARKHWRRAAARPAGSRAPAKLDVASSARWFDGWHGEVDRSTPRALQPARAVAAARTWLLRRGWRYGGLIDPYEIPGGAERRGLAASA
jgi:REP element-mobilizing transposase RayT